MTCEECSCFAGPCCLDRPCLIQSEDIPGKTSKIDPSDNGHSKAPYAGFREVVAMHLCEELAQQPRAAFPNLLEVESMNQPAMAIIDMEDCNNVSKGTNLLVGKDAGMIQLHQFHEASPGRRILHAMLVGHVGASKSVTARKYAKAVSMGHIKALKNIKLVHYINASAMEVEQKSRPFDLLFSQQIGDELTPELQEEGKKWMKENAESTLLVVDGLDRSIEEFEGTKYGKINSETKTKPNVILANIFSETLYKGMRILSTSRPRVYWNLNNKQKPQKVIALRGFTATSIDSIVKMLNPDKAESIIRRLKDAPQLYSLCKNPMFLIYTIQVLSASGDAPQTEASVLAAILRQYSASGHSDADINVLMKLAYYGMIDKRYTFTAQYVESHGISMDQLKGPITVGAVLAPFQERPDKDDLQIEFSHQSLQEVLAAIYPFNFQENEFVNYAECDLDKPGMEVPLNVLFGIVWNPSTRKFVEKYVKDRKCSLEFCQKTLWEYLLQRIQRKTLTIGKIVSAIYECGDRLVAELNHHVQKIDLHWKECVQPHAVLSVVNRFSSLKEVYLRRIEVSSNLMALLLESVKRVKKFKITNLVVYGETSVESFQLLACVVMKATVSVIEFDSCQLNVEKLAAFDDEIGDKVDDILPTSFFEFRVLNETEIVPACIECLIQISTKREKSWITLVGCSTNQKKLDAVHQALESSSRKLHYLYLKEKDFMPTHSDVSCICNILPFVDGQVLLGDWNLTKINLDKLQEALNGHQNSSFGLLLTRNGRTKCLRRGSMEYPDADLFATDDESDGSQIDELDDDEFCCTTPCRLGNSKIEEYCPRYSEKILKTGNLSDEKSERKEVLNMAIADMENCRLNGCGSPRITVTAKESQYSVNVNVKIMAQVVVQGNATAHFHLKPEKDAEITFKDKDED